MRFHSIFAFFLFAIFSFNNQGFTQKVLSGEVLELGTQNALPFVNIGVLGKRKGTVSDMEGKFYLKIQDEMLDDTLRFSMVGYESQEMSVRSWIKQLESDPKVFLATRVNNLKQAEVKISAKPRERIYGNKTKSKIMSAGFASNSLGSEMGIPIKFKSFPAYVEDLTFQINANVYDSLLFRVNFYSLNEKGLPDKSILSQNIIIELTGPHRGKVVIDLSEYHIVCHENIAVCLEWIRDYGIPNDSGLMFSFAPFNKGMFIRHTSQDSWFRMRGAGVGLTLKTIE